MLKEIYFPGSDRQPCVARYGIAMNHEGTFAHADIVVVQTSREGFPAMGTSLINTQDGRNIVLNKILENDLQGVRVEFVSFYVILDLRTMRDGLKLPIRLDFEDYLKQGNPYGTESIPAENIAGKVLQWIGKGDKAYTYHTYHVQGGCARFTTDIADAQVEHLSEAQATHLLERVGYEHASPRLYE